MACRSGVGLLLTLLVSLHAPALEAEPVVVEKDATFGHVLVAHDDVETAIREGDAVWSAAQRVLAISAGQFDIVDLRYSAAEWGERSPAGHPIYPWQFAKGPTNAAIPPPAYLLRHEIGHDLFVRYLVPSTKADQYGGDAPDWLDEAAAVAFEGDMLRDLRRRATVRYAREKRLIPLARFLTMIHPEEAAQSIPAASGRQMTVFTAASDDTEVFYAMASAFYDFLVVRSGKSAILAELAVVARDPVALKRRILLRTGHSPKDGLAALNIDFLTWIETDPRYAVGSGQ